VLEISEFLKNGWRTNQCHLLWKVVQRMGRTLQDSWDAADEYRRNSETPVHDLSFSSREDSAKLSKAISAVM